MVEEKGQICEERRGAAKNGQRMVGLKRLAPEAGDEEEEEQDPGRPKIQKIDLGQVVQLNSEKPVSKENPSPQKKSEPVTCNFGLLNFWSGDLEDSWVFKPRPRYFYPCYREYGGIRR